MAAAPVIAEPRLKAPPNVPPFGLAAQHSSMGSQTGAQQFRWEGFWALQSTKAGRSCCVCAGSPAPWLGVVDAAQQRCVRMSARTRSWLHPISCVGLVLLVCTSLLARRALAQWRPSYPYRTAQLEAFEGVENYTTAFVLQIDYPRWDGYFLNTYTITPSARASACLERHLAPVAVERVVWLRTNSGRMSAL